MSEKPMSEYWHEPAHNRLFVFSLLILAISAGLLLGATWQEHNYQKAMERDNLFFCKNLSDSLPYIDDFNFTIEIK